MSLPPHMLIHEVHVETHQGAGAYGDTYAAAVPVSCFRDETRRLVRAKTGEEVVSETTLYLQPADGAKFVIDSRVKWGDVTTYVLARESPEGWWEGNPAHVEVSLK